MDFLRRQLPGGLSVIVALAAFAGSDFKLTPVVIGLFAFGGLWLAVVAAHSLLGWRRARPEAAVTDRLTRELQAGFELRGRARNASGIPELVEACRAFVEWGLALEEYVSEYAPLHLLELRQTPAPWVLHGKGVALDSMDARLRVLTAIIQKLGEERA